MSNPTIGQLRDMWKNMSDWITGTNGLFKPRVKIEDSQNNSLKINPDGSVNTQLTGSIPTGTNKIGAVDSQISKKLINLLGADGNFEVDSNSDGTADGWVKGAQGTASIDSTMPKYGTKAQRFAGNPGDTSPTRTLQCTRAVENGKHYLMLVDVITDGVSQAELRVYRNLSGEGSTYSGMTTTVSKVLYAKISPIATATATIQLRNSTPAGTTGWVQYDGARLYEISKADYDRIDVDSDWTGDKLAARFPYVDNTKTDAIPLNINPDGSINTHSQLVGSILKQTVTNTYPSNITVLAGATVIVINDLDTKMETEEYAFVFSQAGVTNPKNDIKIEIRYASESNKYSSTERGTFKVEHDIVVGAGALDCRTDFHKVWSRFMRVSVINKGTQDLTIRNSVFLEKKPKGVS